MSTIHTIMNQAVSSVSDAGSAKSKKILLVQLLSLGDCLYATAVARQIKKDFPGCHLTWAIGSTCKSILDGNPYLDEVWEIPLKNFDEMTQLWPQFKREALEKKKHGQFDEVFFTQMYGNAENYDGMIRSSLFRGYPGPITVPLSPVVRLLPPEVENVKRFASSHGLERYRHVILFECSPQSAQSFVTPAFALTVAQKLVSEVPNTLIILSSNKPIPLKDSCIVDGSVLTFRENAELTKYCTLLVGCSSGISWLSTSDWAKPLPMIQLLKPDAFYPASFTRDHEYWGLPTDTIIEMTDCPPEKLVQCISTVINSGFEQARAEYHERIPMTFHGYNIHMFLLLMRGQFIKAAHLLHINIQTRGLRLHLFLLPLPKIFRHIFRAVLRKLKIKVDIP